MNITSKVPLVNRNWLTLLRKLKGLTLKQTYEAIGISNMSYYSVERGANRNATLVSYRTVSKVANYFGIKIDLFFAPCNEQGLLTDTESVKDIFVVFGFMGFKHIMRNKEILESIFTPEVITYIESKFDIE